MSNVRAQRWRGTRRPDVEAIRKTMPAANGSQTARVTSTQQPLLQRTQQQQATSRDDSSFNTNQSYRSTASSTLTTSAGVPHFKYNFLSAGSTIAGPPRIGLVKRPGIMDATRTFEPTDGSYVVETQEEKQARAYQTAQRDRYAGGLGYGTAHPNYYNYLSKSQPTRETESFFGERPCVFPTVELPPLTIRPATDLEQLPYEEQEAYSQPFKTRIASGLGFGKGPNYHAYLANSYWRKR